MRHLFAASSLMGLIGLAMVAAMSFAKPAAHAQDSGGGGSAAPSSAEGAGPAGSDISIPKAKSAEAILSGLQTQLVENAIREGLEELASRQNTEEGPAYGSFGGAEVRVAKSALAGLALVASGSLPGSGPYGDHVERCVEYCLRQQDPNTGFFADSSDHSRIHGHGYCMFFLSQVYGHSSKDKEIATALSRGVRCLRGGQTRHGGWGYVPDSTQFDEGSTTVCCLQALRTSAAVGIQVPQEMIANAVGYLDLSKAERNFQIGDQAIRGYTFKYSVASAASSNSWALAAACVACLNNVGAYSKYARWNGKNIGAVLEGGIQWLYHHMDAYFANFRGGVGLDSRHFYYANFYACQALWQYTDVSLFAAYYARVRDLLLLARDKSGTRYWTHGQYGDAYATALALLVLQLPYQYLPAFQR